MVCELCFNKKGQSKNQSNSSGKSTGSNLFVMGGLSSS